MDFERTEKYVVTDHGLVEPYDHLVITAGRQYTVPKEVSPAWLFGFPALWGGGGTCWHCLKPANPTINLFGIFCFVFSCSWENTLVGGDLSLILCSRNELKLVFFLRQGGGLFFKQICATAFGLFGLFGLFGQCRYFVGLVKNISQK